MSYFNLNQNELSNIIVSVDIKGGLGNQLFQIFSAYAFATKNNYQLQLLKIKNNGNRPIYWDSIFKNINHYLVDNLPSNLIKWYESFPTMYKEINNITFPGIYLDGYLQSSKYFYNDEIKNKIKQLLKPDNESLFFLKNKYKHLFDNINNIVVVHARRTDYIKFSNIHGPLNSTYYKNAVSNILNKISNPIFVLTSDDNDFWNEIKLDVPELFKHEHHIIENETDINTFILFLISSL